MNEKSPTLAEAHAAYKITQIALKAAEDAAYYKAWIADESVDWTPAIDAACRVEIDARDAAWSVYEDAAMAMVGESQEIKDMVWNTVLQSYAWQQALERGSRECDAWVENIRAIWLIDYRSAWRAGHQMAESWQESAS